MKPLILTLCMVLLTSAVAADAGGSVETDLAAANALLAERKTEAARAVFARILERAPSNADARYGLGLLAAQAGDWESALQHQEKAVAADPNNARYQYGWGMANGIAAQKAGVLSKLGHARKCLAAYQRAVELEPRALPYRWALLRFYQQAPGFAGGGFDRAYAQAEAIKEIDVSVGRQAYAQLYVAEKKFDLAFREYDDALRAAPDDQVALYQFGRLTLTTAQRLEEGTKAFQRCLELATSSSQRAHLHWRLGGVWERRNEPAMAREAYQAALGEDPAYRAAHDALAKLASKPQGG